VIYALLTGSFQDEKGQQTKFFENAGKNKTTKVIIRSTNLCSARS
jgi:hypothetical protein